MRKYHPHRLPNAFQFHPKRTVGNIFQVVYDLLFRLQLIATIDLSMARQTGAHQQSLPEKLEKQLALAQATGGDIVYCSYGIMDSRSLPSRADYLVANHVELKQLLLENCIGCSTVLLGRRVVDQYRFEVDFYHEDYVLWLRLLQDGFRAVGCTEVLVRWRLLENSRSFDKRRSAKNRWLIYRNYLKLSVWKSAWYFAGYAVAGLRKYLSK